MSTSPESRWLAGLAAQGELNWGEAAVVEVCGRGDGVRLVRGATRAAPLPPLPRTFSVTSATNADFAQLRAAVQTWAQHLLHLLRLATDEVGVSWHEIICVGLIEPWWHWGIWSDGGFGFPWPMSAWLAEMTGWSIAHSFALRDLAAGGHSRCVTAATDWILFHSQHEPRLILHLGEDILLHSLAPGQDWSAIRAAMLIPGLAVLDRLTAALTGRPDNPDRSGHLAVQGRLIPDLLSRWLAHPVLLTRHRRFQIRTPFDSPWARATSELARQRGWPPVDVLCTACHWLVQNIASARSELGLQDSNLRVLVSGLGCRNGFLWQLLQDKLRPAIVQRSDDFGVAADAALAVRAALLAALLLDQVPAGVPQASGSSGIRLLGQWTPGSLSNWSRCLHWMVTGREPLIWEDS
ncbi:MAG: anhydro-N-acetylmuramic acid kinase [Gemmatales bacterium]|nr:anhydro-N-acetylmuramic acid kinase [Gemmatales bacterium]MDW8222995.1 anhydro-N-acetylmuramic acid kinase [Gemmatales bacterium]